MEALELARMDACTIAKKSPEEIDLAAAINERVEIFKPKFSDKINFKHSAKNTKFIFTKTRYFTNS